MRKLIKKIDSFYVRCFSNLFVRLNFMEYNVYFFLLLIKLIITISMYWKIIKGKYWKCNLIFILSGIAFRYSLSSVWSELCFSVLMYVATYAKMCVDNRICEICIKPRTRWWCNDTHDDEGKEMAGYKVRHLQIAVSVTAVKRIIHACSGS